MQNEEAISLQAVLMHRIVSLFLCLPGCSLRLSLVGCLETKLNSTKWAFSIAKPASAGS
jgi:hypothetical protein